MSVTIIQSMQFTVGGTSCWEARGYRDITVATRIKLVAMSMHGAIGEFSPSQETWTENAERLEFYFEANDIREDAASKKCAILLNVCGVATYKLFRTLAAPAKPSEVEYADLLKLMTEHVTQKPTVMVEWFRFHFRSQQPGETLTAFVSELRRLSEHCKFEAFREEILRDRLVCGIASGAIQRRLLAEAEGLTLQKALDISRAMEAADANLKTLQDPQHTPATDGHVDVHTIALPGRSDRGGPTPTTETPCSRCGRKDHAPNEFRFKSAICYTCRKLGHLARVCRSGPRVTNQPWYGGTARRRAASPRTNALDATEGDQERSQREMEQEEAYALNALRSKTEPIAIHLTINDRDLEMELDTGASVTIMSERTYRSLWPVDPPPLAPSSMALKTYMGGRMQVRGCTQVRVG